MRVPNFSDPQFVDANGLGGLNAAFGQVSGAIGSMGSGIWTQPGLISPESMTLGFGGMIGTANLPAPWGIVNANGIVIRAHGTQTGVDTTNYSVNFTSLIPSITPITAYLAATIIQIQQNPFPLTGPPQGHPSFNPNFVPSTAYATTTYSVALSAVTGGIDNVNTFELARTTLIPGQVSVSSFSTAGWQRAAPLSPRPAAPLAAGGVLAPSQASMQLLPTTPGLTSTLPTAASGGGLSYQLFNPQSTPWTVVTSTGDSIAGAGSTLVNSVGIPPNGAMTLWGNAASGAWDIVGVNPLMMASLPNIFTAPQTIAAPLIINGSGSAALLTMIGNGTVTPNKILRVQNGHFNIINSAGTTNLVDLDDIGNFSVASRLTSKSLLVLGPTSSTANSIVSGGILVDTGGFQINGYDNGGMQLRIISGLISPSAGFRNDGIDLYLMLSNPNSPFGGFNSLRPFTVNLANGAVFIDGTGVGTAFGGSINTPDVIGTIGNIGAVSFGGGGQIGTAGPITTTAGIVAAAVATTGNITAGARLRASFGALSSGDLNAATLLADFPFQSGTNGYSELPNGTIYQWGNISVPVLPNASATLYNLNFAFPGGFSNVFVTLGAFGPAVGQMLGAQPANSSQFYVTLASPTGTGQLDLVQWFAIGHS